jgi:hypothetical protein
LLHRDRLQGAAHPYPTRSTEPWRKLTTAAAWRWSLPPRTRSHWPAIDPGLARTTCRILRLQHSVRGVCRWIGQRQLAGTGLYRRMPAKITRTSGGRARLVSDKARPPALRRRLVTEGRRTGSGARRIGSRFRRGAAAHPDRGRRAPGRCASPVCTGCNARTPERPGRASRALTCSPERRPPPTHLLRPRPPSQHSRLRRPG